MWEPPFELSMLDKEAIISCPTKELASELVELLSKHGMKQMSENVWDRYEERTCFRISGGYDVNYGSRGYYEEEWESYPECAYCTFYGIDTPDFDTATDDELCSLFGV